MDKELQDNANEKEEPEVKSEIVTDGCAVAGRGGHSFFCLSIIGQVEGHYVLDNTQKTTKYDHVIPTLVSVEENDKVDGIIILINTVGGDVEAGLAISEVIASLSKPTVSVVLGGGHSIGVPLAVSAKRSFIVPSATMTIHPVRTSGLVLGVSQSFDYLERMQNRIVRFIVGHSSVDEGYLRGIMHRTDMLVNDIGSILDGYEAVECGLIDEVGGIKEAVSYLRNMINKE